MESHSNQESQQLQAWNLWEILEKGTYLSRSYEGEGIYFPAKSVQFNKPSDQKTTTFRSDSQETIKDINQ